MRLMEDHKAARRWALPLALILAGLLTAVSAQQFTPEEQAEIDADANHVPGDNGGIEILGGITCDGDPQAFYFNDFEADDGGWAPYGVASWEWGAVVTGVHENCGTVPEDEPDGAFSGENVWATNLDGCHPNAGDILGLSQTFDFSELEAPIELNLQHWLDTFGSFDFANIFVNGNSEFFYDGSTPPTDYQQLAVDLSAYAGEPEVTIEFEVDVTTVVNRSGWYIDDVSILACDLPGGGGEIPETTAVPTLNVAMMVLLGIGLLLAGWLVMRMRG